MRVLPDSGSAFGSGVRLLLVAFALVVAAVAVSRVASLLLAVLLTVILALGLEAFASRLERRGVPRGVGALVGLTIGVVTLVGVVALVVPPFVSEVRALTEKAPGAIDTVGRRTGTAAFADGGSAASPSGPP